MNFEPKKKLQDDRLWATHSMVTVIFKYKSIRYTMIAILILHGSTIFEELYFLCVQPEYFLKFVPWLLLKPFGIASTAVVLAKRNAIANVWKGFELWAHDSAGREVEEKIGKAIRNHHRFIFFTIGIGAVLLIVGGLPNPSDCDFYFNLFLFRKLYPKYSILFNLTMKGLYGPLMYSMLSFPLLIIYITQHSLYQCFMWVELIRNVTYGYDGKEDDFLIRNQHYQSVVGDRLKFIAKRHAEIIRFADSWSEHLREIFVVLFLCSFFLGVSLAMIFYGLCTGIYEMNVLNALIAATFTLAAMICASGTANAGQIIESETEKMTGELYNTRWVTLNRKNMSTLLIILTVAGRPIKIRYSQSIVINRELGFRMAKGIYSVVSVFYSTQRK